MWILKKHPAVEGSNDAQFYLLVGRSYVIGRKNCDIVIPGDISISRKHARISVQKINQDDPEQPVEKLTLLDTSKVGVLVNGSKITPNVEEALKDGDLISFGCQNLKYKLIHQRLVIVTSCINVSSSKAAVKTCIEKLGGFTSQTWNEKATHLVMEKLTFTIKVVCAIACGKPIVSVKYLEDCLDCCDKKTGLTLPNDVDYLPPISEQSLVSQELLFQPNDNRRSLMAGKLLIVLAAQQFSRIKDAVQFAGGQIVLKDTKDAKLVNHISSSQTIVLQIEKKDEKNVSASQMNWIKEIYAKLKMLKLRPIRESEIGLAILNVSLEKYCNPTLNAAPAVNGSSHTQVIQDSLCATQQSQVGAENFNATQVFDETQDIQVRQSVSMVQSEKPAVENVLPAADITSNTMKRKRPISENSVDSGKKMHDFFKKPKLKEHKSSLTKIDDTVMAEVETNGKIVILDNDENEVKANKVPARDAKNDHKPAKRENIINIDDDDDEDDVFSFNFSRPCVPVSVETPSTTLTEAPSLVLDKFPTVPTATEQSCIATTHEVDSQSGVLFTPLSKKAVDDSYLPSLVPATSGKPIPETYLPSAVTPLRPNPGIDTTMEKSCVPESCPSFLRKNISDEDCDDDPFSFSVGMSVPILSKLKGKNIKSKENPKPRDADSSKTNSDGEGWMEGGKLASDSDSSCAKSSTDDERQKSRFTKAVSSSQCSDAEDILILDADGNLIQRDGTSQSDDKMKDNTSDPDCKKKGNTLEPDGKMNDSTSEPDSKTDSLSEADCEVKNIKDADMSYLLNDNDDDLDVASREYSLQKQVVLTGFISTVDMRPKLNIIKDEDPDLIGIDTTNLVQTKFASLVMKDRQKKAPRKTSDIPGSKLKNYKTFKKQHFAGTNVQSRVIGRDNFEVYESDNIERATLFSEIREKDEEEAEENRRIDKMFDVIPTSKKR